MSSFCCDGLEQSFSSCNLFGLDRSAPPKAYDQGNSFSSLVVVELEHIGVFHSADLAQGVNGLP